MSGTKFFESLNSAYLVKCRSTKRKYAEKGGGSGYVALCAYTTVKGRCFKQFGEFDTISIDEFIQLNHHLSISVMIC